jgi:TM2 domain-containing membrane protein YozV
VDEKEWVMKRVGVAYLLWFLLGGFGVHKFYLANTRMGLLYLVLFILGWATMGMGLGLFFLLALAVLLIMDIFTIPKQVRVYNEAQPASAGDSNSNEAA